MVSAGLAPLGEEAVKDPFSKLPVEAARAVTRAALDARLIGLAMLVGAVVAALANRRAARAVVSDFFGGAGQAVARLLPLLVAASCFGEGVRMIGISHLVTYLFSVPAPLFLPAAGLLAMLLGALGDASPSVAAMLLGQVASPAALGAPTTLPVAAEHLQAVTTVAALAGQALSPAAALLLVCAALSGARPLALARRVALPLLAGLAAVVLMSLATGAGGEYAPNGPLPPAIVQPPPTPRVAPTPPVGVAPPTPAGQSAPRPVPAPPPGAGGFGPQ